MTVKTPIHRSRLRALSRSFVAWFDTSAPVPGSSAEGPAELVHKTEWSRLIPFIGLHLACFGAIWTGWSPTAVVVAVSLYFVRMFAVTAFYHRYFSHRTFSTGRWTQLVFAVIGNSAAQRGPLWWAAHHREHHRHSDTPRDIHSPHIHGLIWSHMGWFTSRDAFATNVKAVPDLAKFPELRFLDRFDILVPSLLAVALFGLGWSLERWAPGLGTGRWQMLVWGFFISTIAVYHATYTINSLCHLVGTRRFKTRDSSRNNFWLALLTLGEGWHNNHHFSPGSARQGFYWWEIDLTYYVLVAMSKLGIVWNLRPVPAKAYRVAVGTLDVETPRRTA